MPANAVCAIAANRGRSAVQFAKAYDLEERVMYQKNPQPQAMPNATEPMSQISPGGLAYQSKPLKKSHAMFAMTAATWVIGRRRPLARLISSACPSPLCAFALGFRARLLRHRERRLDHMRFVGKVEADCDECLMGVRVRAAARDIGQAHREVS